jgi:ubiquinone/menaquinone biosynthesis C-methylase UbiE
VRFEVRRQAAERLTSKSARNAAVPDGRSAPVCGQIRAFSRVPTVGEAWSLCFWGGHRRRWGANGQHHRCEGNPTRPFAGDTAGFYALYRRTYPPELVAHLEHFGCSGGARLLDLGCGTGTLALQLAPSFEHVIGIDPEPDMLDEARRAAREQRIMNVDWIRAGSPALPELEPVLGTLDLVTIGTAFHFMEPRTTLSDLQRVAPGGVVVVAYNGAPMWLHSDPWAKTLRAVLESRLGRRLSDVDFTAEALNVAEETMLDLGYSQIERWDQTHLETIDVSFIVGHILSATSIDQIPLAERQEFIHDLTSAITSVAPSGSVVETVGTGRHRPLLEPAGTLGRSTSPA